MTTFIASTAERARQKRQLAEQAVKLAMQNNWQGAADVNRQIIELVPEEAEAWNRLGKALSELGRYAEAHNAYQEALKRDPNNSIALKQVKRLALLIEETPAEERAQGKLDPRLLIEETGKTGTFELESPAAPPVLARMAAGDEVFLKVQGNDIVFENSRGQTLGQLPPKPAARLIELMNGGNRYVAGVISASERSIRVLIREVFQSPQMAGRVSFPAKGGPLPAELRALSRDRALRFDLDEEDLLAEDNEEEGEGEAETEETTTDVEYYEEREDRNRR
ncbi:MAG: tetratricopeptide repeat protein [Chloroflexi bacterium]|nr:tetratricopeptide repeat protein [Chloroflexota bacterium]